MTAPRVRRGRRSLRAARPRGRAATTTPSAEFPACRGAFSGHRDPSASGHRSFYLKAVEPHDLVPSAAGGRHRVTSSFRSKCVLQVRRNRPSWRPFALSARVPGRPHHRAFDKPKQNVSLQNICECVMKKKKNRCVTAMKTDVCLSQDKARPFRGFRPSLGSCGATGGRVQKEGGQWAWYCPPDPTVAASIPLGAPAKLGERGPRSCSSRGGGGRRVPPRLRDTEGARARGWEAGRLDQEDRA